MTHSRRTLGVVTVVLLLGLLGGGVWWRLRSEGGEGGQGEAQAAETESPDLPPPIAASQQFSTDVPQPVRGVEVVRDTLWITVTAAGQAEAHRRAAVTARVEGIVETLRRQENDRVTAGATLLTIDSTEYALAVDQARSDLLTAEAEFRQMVLFDDEIEDPEVRAERERLARSRSGLEQAEVALRRAELDLARTRVTAPFAGRIANIRVVPGQYVSQGGELMTVVDLDPIKVEVQVLEAELGYLEEGRSATVTFAAFPAETFRGRIETANPVVDPETRTGRVTLLLANPEGRIKPGMYARVTLDARSFPDRTLVPRAALLERDGRPMLFVFDGEGEGEAGRAEWRYVTPGLEGDSLVELVRSDESFVEPGEIVLVEGHHYLAHDAPIRLTGDPEAEGGRPGR